MQDFIDEVIEAIDTPTNSDSEYELKRLLGKCLEKIEYWQKRCEAAEKYIDASPCDPDITAEQIDAYREWKNLLSEMQKTKQ